MFFIGGFVSPDIYFLVKKWSFGVFGRICGFGNILSLCSYTPTLIYIAGRRSLSTIKQHLIILHIHAIHRRMIQKHKTTESKKNHQSCHGDSKVKVYHVLNLR